MEYKEIEEVPCFEPDLDETLLSKMDKNDPVRSILINTSVLRQQMKWGCETARLAFNLSLQNEKRINWFRTWTTLAVGGAVVAAAMKFLLTK